jgi:hypothetical protein
MSSKMKQKNYKLDASNVFILSFIVGVIALIFAGVVFLEIKNSLVKKESLTSFDQMAYEAHQEKIRMMEELDSYWEIPELRNVLDKDQRELIKYGRETDHAYFPIPRPERLCKKSFEWNELPELSLGCWNKGLGKQLWSRGVNLSKGACEKWTNGKHGETYQ